MQDADDAPAFTQEFMPHCWRGYQQAYRLEPQWLQEIPAFLKVREILLYAAMYCDDVDSATYRWQLTLIFPH